MASIDTVSMPGGLSYDINDFGHYPLWSTHAGITSQNQGPIDGFTYSKGESIPGTANRVARELDTNLKASSPGLGYQEEMMIFSLMLELPQLPLDQGDPLLQDADHLLIRDFQTIYENTLFQLLVSEKVYNEGTIGRYPFGGGLWGVSDINGHEMLNNGAPTHRAQKPLAIPIHIQALEPFYTTLKFPYGNVGELFNTWDTTDAENPVQVGYDVRAWLDGIRRRAVA
jgi:hypothetical protein